VYRQYFKDVKTHQIGAIWSAILISLPVFKTLVVGDTTAGKTTLLLRFVDGTWDGPGTMTVGVDFKAKDLKIDGKRMKAQFWDAGGMEGGRRIVNTYFRNTHCVVVVFTVKLRSSFAFVNDWVTDALKLSPPGIFIALIGNQCDLPDREVTREEAEETARRFGIPYFETSAKTDEGVENAFQTIVTEGIRRIPNFFDPPSESATSGSPKKDSGFGTIVEC
jgi:small GTP-binding protein